MKTKMTQEEFIKYTERMNKNIVSLLKGNEEELAFYSQLVISFNNVCEKNDRLEKKINGLINETEQQCKKQKEIINKAIEYINDNLTISSILDGKKYYTINNYSFDYRELLDILKEVE